jgi:cyclohexanone monooxygenase
VSASSASGQVHDVDILVFATGFDAGTGPLTTRMDVVGRGGRTLKEHWSAGARTHLGLMADGFPNLFMLDGPQSSAAFFSPPLLTDYQSQLIARILDRLESRGARTLEPRAAEVDDWSEHVDEVTAMTLLPKARSRWMGQNIPGKPRQSLYYIGGFPEYRRRCELILDEDLTRYEVRGEHAGS